MWNSYQRCIGKEPKSPARHHEEPSAAQRDWGGGSAQAASRNIIDPANICLYCEMKYVNYRRNINIIISLVTYLLMALTITSE
jgi:hypothetical protein